ncbi:MAG: hypothetical protein H6R21_795 [Proteobacteria bacterium]|nr:hypothetical protein [Pseudomonadota bacterium]
MPGARIIAELSLTWLDIAASLFFVLSWAGYATFAQWRSKSVPTLHSAMDGYRRQWMVRMIERDNRMVDVNIMRNLVRSSQFFASTTMLVLGALIALLGYVQQAMDVVSGLPFTVKASTLIGAAPKQPAENPEQFAVEINRVAAVTSYAGTNFNDGLRAYYFALAALTWFLHPYLMLIATAWVVYVLYHREFESRTLYALTKDDTSSPVKT